MFNPDLLEFIICLRKWCREGRKSCWWQRRWWEKCSWITAWQLWLYILRASVSPDTSSSRSCSWLEPCEKSQPVCFIYSPCCFMAELGDVTPRNWKASRRINRSSTCTKPLHFVSFISSFSNLQARFAKGQRGERWWAKPGKVEQELLWGHTGANPEVPVLFASRLVQQQLTPNIIARLKWICAWVTVWNFVCCWSCPRLYLVFAVPPMCCRSCHFLNNDKFQGRVGRGKKEGWRNLLVATPFYRER